MRTLTYDKKEIRFTEKQIKELLYFFNPRGVQYYEGLGEYYIKRNSPICPRSRYGPLECDECSIGKVLGEHSCNDLLRRAGGSSVTRYLYIDDEGIEWAKSHDRLARRMLERIRKFIEELPRI